MSKRSLTVPIFIFLMLAPVAHATTVVSGGLQDGGAVTSEGSTLVNPLNLGNCSTADGGCLGAFLNAVLQFVVRIGAIVVILMLVYVGYEFVMAQGEPGKITEARQALLWTVVGALILLGAQVIALGIQATVQALSVGQ